MNYLFFDTETTSLLRFDLDLMDPRQPRICQLAALLTDETGQTLESLNAIIKPDGWTVPDEAAAINHLTTAICEADGIPMPEALELFNNMKSRCIARVAFNINYDKQMLAREEGIYGIPHDSTGLSTYCVMELAKPICKLPPTERMLATGRTGYKPPKLTEAYRHFFGKDFDRAHDAMADVKACRDIFFKLFKTEPVSVK